MQGQLRQLRDFQEINYPILWGGQHERLWLLGTRVAHPTINSWIFFIKKGRGQEAGGRREYCLLPLPVTVRVASRREGNKGIKPHRLYGAYNWLGSESPSNCSFCLLPSAFCLLQLEVPKQIFETVKTVLTFGSRERSSSTREQSSSTRERSSSTREQSSSSQERSSSTRERSSSTREQSSSTREQSSSTREQSSSTREQSSSSQERSSSTRERSALKLLCNLNKYSYKNQHLVMRYRKITGIT